MLALAAIGDTASAQHVARRSAAQESVERGLAFDDNGQAREVALAAVEAARSAGASYADVRVDAEIGQSVSVWQHRASGAVHYNDRFTYGVRVIANGQWGFAGDREPTADAAAQCARRAVAQANANAGLRRNPVVLVASPTVSDGTWATRIAIDPFTIPPGEQQDLLLGAVRAALAVRGVRSAGGTLAFWRTQRTFASSEGSFIAQTMWFADPDASAQATASSNASVTVSRAARTLVQAAAGYEVVKNARLNEAMIGAAEEAVRVADIVAQARPVDVGRYDVVLSAPVMARLVAGTLGQATGMDRVIGKRAAYEGTSFAAPPEQVLGRPIASELVHLTANRTMPGGLATVGWDDDGVESHEFTLVDSGTLVDYQTTRESAMALSWWYEQQQQPLRSHGCASGGGLGIPQEAMPNLRLAPHGAAADVGDLIAGIERGILFTDARGGTDETVGTGTWWAAPGGAREIRRGQLGGVVRDAAMQFRTRDLWMALDALGGRGSVESVAVHGATVRAAPGRFRGVNIVNGGTAI
jgi:TldD protein